MFDVIILADRSYENSSVCLALADGYIQYELSKEVGKLVKESSIFSHVLTQC